MRKATTSQISRRTYVHRVRHSRCSYMYKAVCFHLEKHHGDPYEQERLQHLKDFLYRIILEYKYQID